MVKRFFGAITIASLVVLVFATTVFAVSINWGASQPVRDELNQPLADGDLVQLILDDDRDGIDPPNSNGLPAYGDVLLDTSTIYSFPDPGTFSDSVNAGSVGEGAFIYARAWNAPAPASATRYGNSQVYTVHTEPGQVSFTVDVTIAYTDKPWPPPTAVDLAYFSAKSKLDYVLLFWETVSEANIVGFDVQRGPTQDGPWQKLNPVPIPTASPGSGGGAAYSWADKTVPGGGTYYYRLDQVLTDGSSRSLAVTQIEYRADRTFWLPLLLR